MIGKTKKIENVLNQLEIAKYNSEVIPSMQKMIQTQMREFEP